jgi:uncharacterized protein
MLIVLSPAKSLDFTPPAGDVPVTLPRLATEAAALGKVARKLKASDLSSLMHISAALGELNAARFKAFDAHAQGEGTKQALLAFNGDVYRGFEAESLDAAGLAFAQAHVRILSGLYGLLRPTDLIMPHRLEMGTRLATRRGETLYDWWGPRIGKLLAADLKALSGGPLINLASSEYFSSVDRKSLKSPVITPHFKELKDGQARVLGVFAKLARGRMARFAVDNAITDAEALKGFDRDGYRFDPALSGPSDWVFTRPQPPLKG